MSAKMATLNLLKIKVFWNEGYDVIISVYDVTNKILFRDSNYIVDVVMWPKFGYSSIFMREVNCPPSPAYWIGLTFAQPVFILIVYGCLIIGAHLYKDADTQVM